MQKETTTASPRTLFVKVDPFDTKNRDCAGNVWRSAGNAFLETVGRKSRIVGETTVLNICRCMINYKLFAYILCFYTNGTGIFLLVMAKLLDGEFSQKLKCTPAAQATFFSSPVDVTVMTQGVKLLVLAFSLTVRHSIRGQRLRRLLRDHQAAT